MLRMQSASQFSRRAGVVCARVAARPATQPYAGCRCPEGRGASPVGILKVCKVLAVEGHRGHSVYALQDELSGSHVLKAHLFRHVKAPCEGPDFQRHPAQLFLVPPVEQACMLLAWEARYQWP